MRNGKFEFLLDKAKKVHNNFYDYSSVVEPKRTTDAIIVICPIHGPFETTFEYHANGGAGCPKCSGVYKPTTEEFIEVIKKVHSDKNYDFSKVEYKNSKTKVIVTCMERDILGRLHGDFEIRPDHLRNGVGCPKCAHRYLTTEEVVEMAKSIHGDKYDYSLVEYHNDNTERLPIICHNMDGSGLEHGIFRPVWYSHISGVGCPKCNGGVKFNKKLFIDAARKIHGDKYDYSKFIYVNANTKGIITCSRHGDFLQSPYLHTNLGRGCPKCKASRLESLIINRFDKLGIDYEYQVSMNGLSDKQTLDFYIPAINTYIECQGEQHYVPVSFKCDDDGVKLFAERVQLDAMKYKVCIENGSRLIYFTNPDMFYSKDVNVTDGFYSDKTVFTNVDELVEEMQLLNISEAKPNGVVDSFIKDVKSISNNALVSGRKIYIGDKLIVINPMDEKDSSFMSERRRSYIRRGFKVIEVFEDEYITRKDIVLSKLSYILGKYNGAVKINGRDCHIKGIDNNEASEFLEANHIQGFVNSTVYLGCFNKHSDLIAVMTFTEESSGKWNLTRYATKGGTLCRGVGSKMLKYFIEEYEPDDIKTFSDKRWCLSSDDNLYIKMGFTLCKKGISPEYRYWKGGETTERIHKFNFRKQKLSKKYGFPVTMTELEMAKALGYDRIWDCGLFKYVWRKETHDES